MDLVTKNNQLLKLPVNKYDESLKNFMKIKDQVKFKEYKILIIELRSTYPKIRNAFKFPIFYRNK